MPQRTDERVLRFMAERGFVPNEQDPKPLLKPIYSFVKRINDEQGVPHKVVAGFHYGYSKNEVAGIPKTCYIRCEDENIPYRYGVNIRGRHKVFVFFDSAVTTAVMNARMWKTKDKELKQLAQNILNKTNAQDNNPGHAPAGVKGGPNPGA